MIPLKFQVPLTPPKGFTTPQTEPEGNGVFGYTHPQGTVHNHIIILTTEAGQFFS